LLGCVLELKENKFISVCNTDVCSESGHGLTHAAVCLILKTTQSSIKLKSLLCNGVFAK